MIKIARCLYIHILTVILFIVCIISNKSFEIISAYCVMTVHELAHTVAAAAIGLRISRISFFPFGVNLKLKNTIVAALSDEIILYASGPLANAFFALAANLLYQRFPLYKLQYFYILNTALFIVNLLPALPLDGGIILKKILIYKIGSKSAVTVLKVISSITAAGMLIGGIYVIILTGFNFSVLLLAVVLIGNIFTQTEKYNLDSIKELMFYKNKSKKHTAVKTADIAASDREIIKSFDFGKYNIVFFIDENGKIKKTLTETEIINNLLKK